MWLAVDRLPNKSTQFSSLSARWQRVDFSLCHQIPRQLQSIKWNSLLFAFSLAHSLRKRSEVDQITLGKRVEKYYELQAAVQSVR